MIRNPAFPGDPVYDMAFNLYAMEEEGLIPTKRGTLNALCNYLIEYKTNDIEAACIAVGVDWDLTEEDLEYISNKLVGQIVSMGSTIDIFFILWYNIYVRFKKETLQQKLLLWSPIDKKLKI